jgi:Uma2 family endonuclease
MTWAFLTVGRPMTEASYLALGETPDHIELFDGSLYLTPPATPRHQHVCSRLAVALADAAPHVLRSVNLRLRRHRILIPDLVLTDEIDLHQLVVDAGAVRLVCEVLSPSSSATDRVLKMHCYAAAAIPWYLLVEPDTGTLQLYRLTGTAYAEHSVTVVGDVLRLTDPATVTLDPAALLPAG